MAIELGKVINRVSYVVRAVELDDISRTIYTWHWRALNLVPQVKQGLELGALSMKGLELEDISIQGLELEDISMQGLELDDLSVERIEQDAVAWCIEPYKIVL